MNLLADESVDRPVVERLRQEGHDVVSIAELSPSITDEEVLQQANARDALLVTADKDFGELVFRQGRVHAGVVLLRLAGLPNTAKAEVVAEVFRDRAAGSVQCGFPRRGTDSPEPRAIARWSSRLFSRSQTPVWERC